MRILFIITTLFSFIIANDSITKIAPREAFNIPLAKLAVSYDDETGLFDKVRITYDNSPDNVYITRYGDQYIHNTKQGREKHVYPEAPEKAYLITEFEAKHVVRISKGLIETLEMFEKDLQKNKWDRCRYLDSYLPRFLRGYYMLLCAARNNPEALPKIALIPESEYDVSLNSPKSDNRVEQWMKHPEQLLKLRIITKEFIYQLKKWQKDELNNPRKGSDLSYDDNFEEAFSLFIRIYFNFKSQS